MKEIFEGKDGQHYFHVKAANGEIVAGSEGYASASNAERGYNALLRAVREDVMADLLRIMFKGWMIREASYVRNPEWQALLDKPNRTAEEDRQMTYMSGGDYGKSEEDAMIEAADGNTNLGLLLHYFSHWSNDIQSIAAHYGIGLQREGDVADADSQMVLVDVPPAPSPLHWWNDDAWQEPIDPEEDAAAGLSGDHATAVAAVHIAEQAVKADDRRGRRSGL